MKTRRNRDITRFILLLVIVLLVNVIGSMRFFRIDLTAEQRFSLSDVTIDLLNSFDEQIYVKVYLDGDFPAGFQRLQRETRQMLDEFRAYNPGIQYEFIDPSGSEDNQVTQEVFEQLQFKGLKYYELMENTSGSQSVQRVFPGAILNLGDSEVPVNLLLDQLGASPEQQINASVQNLEYSLANAVRSLVKTDKPSIAFLQGHGELTPENILDFARSLSQNYNIDRFNLRKFKSDSTGQSLSIMGQQRRLNRFDAVVIAKPRKPFTDLDKFLLDQYIMTGGKILWLIDAVQADMDSLSERPQFMSFPIYDRLNIDDMLFRYGARINTNLVLDRIAAGVSDTRRTYPWIYFPMIMPQVKHPIAKDVNAVKLEFPASVDTIISPGIRKTFLMRSSPYSRIVATPHIVKLQKLYELPPEQYFNQRDVPVALLLEGEFQSAFVNRVTPREESGEPIKLIEKSQPTQQLVVADGDIIRNQLNLLNPDMPKGTPLPLGFDQFTGAQYGNKDFMLNAVDYLLDDSGLIDIRSRELRIRLLDNTRIKNSKLIWQLVNTALPVLLIVLMGMLYSVLRKRRYAKK
jgi:ABC-2 type transport system permease protein